MASLGTPALFHLRRSPEPLVPANVGSVVGDTDPPQDVPAGPAGPAGSLGSVVELLREWTTRRG